MARKRKTLIIRIRQFFLREEKKVTYGRKGASPERLRLSMESLDTAFQDWVERKCYRIPHRNIEEAAESIGTDKATLNIYFREIKQCDFRSWRTRRRIMDAMEIMKEEPLTPISVIGERVGFSDRSNFSRQFRKISGLTPTDWKLSL